MLETNQSTPKFSSEYNDCLEYLENSWIQLRKCSNAESFFKKLFTLDFFGYTQEFSLKVNSLSSTQFRFKQVGFPETAQDTTANSASRNPNFIQADTINLHSQHIHPVFILDFYELLISQYELLGEIQKLDCIQNISMKSIISLPILLDMCNIFNEKYEKRVGKIVDFFLEKSDIIKERFTESLEVTKTFDIFALNSSTLSKNTTTDSKIYSELFKLNQIMFIFNSITKNTRLANKIISNQEHYDFLLSLANVYSASCLNISPNINSINPVILFAALDLKWSILSITNNSLSYLVQHPDNCNLTDNICNPTKIASFLFRIVSTLPVDLNNAEIPFYNANFLTDLNYSFNISEKISDLFKTIENTNSHLLCGFDKDQAEYVLMNLESLSGSIDADFRDNTAFLNQEIENNPNDVIGLDELDQNAALMLEMFPSLSVENLRELLIACNNDLELAISKRLDGDNSHTKPKEKQLNPNVPSQSSIESIKMKEMEEYLKKRRNIFDNDELDIFNSNEIDESKILNGTSKSPKKYDLNSALKGIDNERVLAAALLLEEDEYDDTLEDNYGVNLGLSGSESESEGESKDKNRNSRHNNSNGESTDIRDLDSLLGKLAISDPSVFSKSSIIRRSAARQKLIEETNLSNEQIEGWYTMLNRDPSRKSKLEKTVLVQSRNNHLESNIDNSAKEPSGSKNTNNSNNSSSKYKGKHNRRANSNKKFNQSFGFSQEK
ncbi:CUE domain-containing protein 3 [Smittium culicis]|uniref:CUE domain-containing protein 3 n=1 Tax=Smittium culicis TaxID=133412 RepID=A0A1R1XF02_9FUNG|nr:CUE domain-containing protein 3 [Smittium culicis]